MATGQLYSHLIPLTLLLVDGNFHVLYYVICPCYKLFRLHIDVADIILPCLPCRKQSY